MSEINITRCPKNPLIKPSDVKPSKNYLKIDGVFNCAATKYNDEYILICRVAESVINDDVNVVKVPILKKQNNDFSLTIVDVDKNDKNFDFSDPRTIFEKSTGRCVYLTGISHFRLARSKNGVDFVIDDYPTIFPDATDETWGIEDPRCTKIGEDYFINYTAVSEIGISTNLIKTTDFKKYERLGPIFLPTNKDVTIFPEKINGRYVAFNRPSPSDIGTPDIWLSYSPDLKHWGEYKHFIGVAPLGSWDDCRVGGGAVPFKTEKGFVVIYHASDNNNRYCLGAFLLDANDPSKIIGRSKTPILEPVADYELNGFFGNVVFTCGCIFEDNKVNIYYGAADDKICLASIEINEIYKSMDL